MSFLIGLLTLGSPTMTPMPPIADATVAMARCHPYAHKVRGCGRSNESAGLEMERLAERDTTCRQLPGKLRLCDRRTPSENWLPGEMRADNESRTENDG